MKMLLLAFVLLTTVALHGQTANGKLKFRQGQDIGINMEVKTTISQVANGQSIDFNVEGAAAHGYKVTNVTDDNATLHHEVKRIQFTFEGMGQKRPFDSDNPKDLDGPLGKPVKEILKKTYDLIIDPNGKVLMSQPEKVEAAQMDERMKLMAAMLKDILDVVQPPLKGTGSFFKVIPDKEVAIGESWTDTYENEAGKFSDTYTLKTITDSTIIVSLEGTSSTVSKMEIMAGMEVITTLNNKTTGTVTLDKASGIIRERATLTESTGTTQGFGGETPVTSKTSTTIKVTL